MYPHDTWTVSLLFYDFYCLKISLFYSGNTRNPLSTTSRDLGGHTLRATQNRLRETTARINRTTSALPERRFNKGPKREKTFYGRQGRTVSDRLIQKVNE